MKKFIKATILALTLSIGLGAFIPTPTFAAENNVCNTSAAEDVKRAAGCPEYGSNDALFGVIRNILSVIIGVVGLVSAIYIVVGGVNYMTANGDASKLEKAKKTILYALIGLIVAALAFVIVQFVITDVIKAPSA